MTTHASSRSGWQPFGPAAGLRGALVVAGMTLLLAGCGHGPNAPSKAAAKSAKPTASAAAKSAPASAPAASASSSAAASSAQVQQQAAAAQAKLASMSVPDLLSAARSAYAQNHVVAPAGANAMEDYEAVLAKDPGNQVAKDALRETFPFGVPDVEKSISQNNFAEADREIGVLAKADPTNYTLTLLRSKLDAQKKLQARQQQEAQQQAQRATELAAAQKSAAAKAAVEEKEAAARQAAAQQAAAAKVAAASAAPKPVAPPPAPKPVGATRLAKVVEAASPQFPIQAARNQTSGYAVVQFTVAADGSIEDPHVVASSPRRVFDNAAVQAIRRSKFEPALKDGQPVASVLSRRIDFKFGG